MENKRTTGRVWLAGAGPGDAGLITVKTKSLMEQADVILYDALVGTEIISQIPASCRTIYVGKRSGNHTIRQEEINRLLLEEAKKGHRVLRLKGGDPFVFGRGGEELELLVQEGIPFEVVPGVTAAAAVPAYAGIPVTHRDYTSSFHIITGHAKGEDGLTIDYPSLVSLKATLVFLMGVSAMAEICRGLRAAGMPEDMPAAVIERGTTSASRKVISTLRTLCDDTKAACIKAPAVIVVGQVAELGERFHWAEDRVLGGRQFIVTRPRARISQLTSELRDLGAQVIEMPSIQTKAITPNAALDHMLSGFAQEESESWLVFTSPAGVQVFFEELNRRQIDLRNLFCRKGDTKIAVIGSATAGELRGFGLYADLVPAEYCAADLGEALAKTAASDSKIAIVRARKGSEELLPPLQKAGLQVVDIPLYDTIYETAGDVQEKIAAAYTNGEVDAVTFTSASTVEGFVNLMPGLDYTKVTALCIGERTADAARRLGMPVLVSEAASIESMVLKIRECYGR